MAKSEKKALTVLLRTVLLTMTVLCTLMFTGCPNMAEDDDLLEGGNDGGGSRSISKYAVTFGADGANGTLTAEVDGKPVASGNEVEKDKNVVFTAHPNKNYIVDKWTITGGGFEANTGQEGSLNAKVKVTAAVKVTVTFKAVPAGSVKYTVEHWHQNIEDDEYTKGESENKTGAAGEQTRAAAKTYPGFTAKSSITQETIAADGSTAVKVYYDRKIITLTLDFNGGRLILPEPNKLKGRFEAAVSVNTPIKDGYTFKGWDPKLPDTFPAEDGTYTAQWGEKYYKVRYAEFEAHLDAGKIPRAPDGRYYIEITDIKASDLCKDYWKTAPLGETIKKESKKKGGPKLIALKLPARVEGLTKMISCFQGCTNLASLENFPEGVTDLQGCFQGCTTLTKVPAIPAGVTNMTSCFDRCVMLREAPVIPESVMYMIHCFINCTRLTYVPVIPAKVERMPSCFEGCRSLTQVPDIPASVTDMRSCFEGCTSLEGVKLNCSYTEEHADGKPAFTKTFKDCTALKNGGIQVKAAHYDNYTETQALNTMEVPGTTEQDKKAKFRKF